MDTSSENAKRKRGRPRKYPTSEAKAAADVKRRRVARQGLSSVQRDTVHANFYGSLLAPGSAEGSEWVNIFSDSRLPNNPTGPPQPDQRDISQFLTEADCGSEEHSEEHAVFDSEPTACAADSPTHSNQGSSGLEDIAFDEPQEAPFQTANDGHDPVGHLAQELAEQLIEFQGCCHDCHQAAKQSRVGSTGRQVSLATYLGSTVGLGLDVLGRETLASQKDDLAGKISPEARKKIFCGLDSRAEIPHICLDEDERVSSGAGVTFDVDSMIGFPSSLAVAKRGIRWSPTRMAVSDLQSDLHLQSLPVTYFDPGGFRHQVHRPIHLVPHYTFGRVIGFEDISLYFLFPRLYRAEQKSSKLRDEDFQLWMDDILLPAIYQSYSSAQVQHYPSSYDHSRYNSTARGVETLSHRVYPVAREQQLVYSLPPEPLAEIWASICRAVQRPGFQQFQDVTILLQAKNLKTITKDVTWEKMTSRFEDYWTSSIEESYVTADFYIDIGKETCPRQNSKAAPHGQAVDEINDGPKDMQSETLLYKRCCLESYASQVLDMSTGEGPHKQVFYPFSMLQNTGSLTIETGKRSQRRTAGLLYSQFYPSIKEVFAAGNVYPFTNTAIETLALDKKLRKTWELVGGGLSHQPAALVKAYLYTKLRCHFASLGSMQKSFGIREEHRVSRDLFHAIGHHIHSRGVANEDIIIPTGDDSPYYSFTTNTLLRWVRWNINKFCVGFEMVYSFQDPHFVTWEHTRIMLMFLRCLQFSYAGGLIQKVGGCWQDVRQQPDPHQRNGLRRYEGLGFKRTMEMYGYAWFLDKIDWGTLTFRQPHAAYMMFNSPSMQTAYRARYHQVRDVRIDFIRVDKAYQWMLEFSSIPVCLDLLERYLRELCLCTFRKDVFFHVKSTLKPECMGAALAGEIPLCYASVNNAMRREFQPLQLAEGNRLAIKDVNVLFAWLWKTRDGHFERNGWNEKPYRMLFEQSFHAIKTARGKAGARKWRQELKRSFLGSHWILPYPHSRGFMRKGKEEKQFIWWPSMHYGLVRHYAKSPGIGTVANPLPAPNVESHPIHGWKLASSLTTRKGYMPYVILPEQELIQMPESEFYARLVDLREEGLTGPSRIPSAARILELDGSPDREYFPYRWCNIKQERIAKTFEECDQVNDCLWFLRRALETYENLQSRRPNRRKRRRNCSASHLDSDSDSMPENEEAEATSDEESIVVMRKQQGQVVRKMETRVRDLIQEFKKKYPQWQNSYNPEMKELRHRLERVD